MRPQRIDDAIGGRYVIRDRCQRVLNRGHVGDLSLEREQDTFDHDEPSTQAPCTSTMFFTDMMLLLLVQWILCIDARQRSRRSTLCRATQGVSMTDLLDIAVKAHGRLDRWDKVNAIEVAASITGAIWYVKGKGDVLKNVVVTAETHHERVTVDFPGQDKRAVFEPGRIVIERVDKTPIAVRDDPEKSFDGQEQETPWDDIDVAYFAGEALWTYLNTPFLYTRADFMTEEIPSIRVEDETWRRLKVTFPKSVKSHSREQISCFGPDGLLRRHDYTVDILGGATGLNYASDYRDVDGIIVPTKRRVYAYEGDYQLVKEPLLVAIDMGEITLL
jgi:hypothetical protein